MCIPKESSEVVHLILHGVDVQPHAGTIFGVKLILYYQFFSIDVGVSASSQLRCEMDITTCGGSHVPFTGDRAPIEAATFPSRGTGRP